jgi:serine/threonine protein kinase
MAFSPYTHCLDKLASAQHAIGLESKKSTSTLNAFMAWVDIQEYRAIPTEDYRRSKALHIYHKYVKHNAVLKLHGISESECTAYSELLDMSRRDSSVLQSRFFDLAESHALETLFVGVYQQYRESAEFLTLKDRIRSRYNVVRVDDFVYEGKLGEGGFGLVVACRKRSTGVRYAMKIQTKRGLLECFYDEPERVGYEKRAFASCQHPFIVNLDYAFQTSSLGIMVLGLATGGDLEEVLQSSRLGRLPEPQVKLYVAEIVLALGYLHQMGMMYRDLKPSNVLLRADGHIQLVDLGGVIDQDGSKLGKKQAGLLPVFNQAFTAEDGEDEPGPASATVPPSTGRGSGGSGGSGRRLSVMGTFGYMAPEMVLMLTEFSSADQYTKAVDWWSLGVTMYKLLVGRRPFIDDNHAPTGWAGEHVGGLGISSRRMGPSESAQAAIDAVPEYGMLFKGLDFPKHVSREAASMVRGLLHTNEIQRLGFGPTGLADIKQHAFFRGLDWALLEQKHVVPPFIPGEGGDSSGQYRDEEDSSSSDPEKGCVYANFAAMMQALGRGHWCAESSEDPHMLLTDEENKPFADWDFVSASTLKMETGIAAEMLQYDRNFKVRQIMGDQQGTSSRNSHSIGMSMPLLVRSASQLWKQSRC